MFRMLLAIVAIYSTNASPVRIIGHAKQYHAISTEYFLASRNVIMKSTSAEQLWKNYLPANSCNRSSNPEETYAIKYSSLTELTFNGICSYEKTDWIRMFNLLPKHYIEDVAIASMKILLCTGDCNSKFMYPSILLSKVRVITGSDDRGVTLLPLNVDRHFGLISLALGDNTSYFDKKPIAVWRGSTTGPVNCWQRGLNLTNSSDCSRWNLVVRWANSPSPTINIGISEIVQQYNYENSIYASCMKSTLTINDLLRYRYIVSVEGNDVATNLKWALASNSVVFMPNPTIESFFGEGRLKPYVHYIPILPDTSDLEEKVKFCEARKGLCHSISINARKYAKQFSNISEIYKMSTPVLETHLNAVRNLAFKYGRNRSILST